MSAFLVRRDADGILHLQGELVARDLPGFLECLAAELQADVMGNITLDLAELDLLDATAVIGLLERLRGLADSGRTVVVRHAPQNLAHSLYRVGALSHPGLQLVEPREEEPYG
ncbi:hypothetical protein BJI67_15365 [Acidihalobacter aeolianus]|uniref:STAS domain-containing protein n=1 Tax=Acidihalobacter aeolianus TaxID=2792603 RepID=A0A1D8KBF2_9GAMM|nr:STAS domain-containing protein [Acidihalobacter aeolianus]AOV18257.1 hypothetical protein BJI67_15365 [Acidihalobacter aeolianus]